MNVEKLNIKKYEERQKQNDFELDTYTLKPQIHLFIKLLVVSVFKLLISRYISCSF